ncbi:MAG: DHH family phosphoesterase [Desulfovibrionaceae bacterium]|nr:DHH family phosphoesterase [Desulfovibrionaceae bacterium]
MPVVSGKIKSRIVDIFELCSRKDDWLILINADPDAMASALALKRILVHRTRSIKLARINEIARPDNLAMIRYIGIDMIQWMPELLRNFSRFALVDSQPAHNILFQQIPFDIIIDHHPVTDSLPDASYIDIRPKYGAVSTMMTEYLRQLHIRPGMHLATALQYGIRTDTASFTRGCTDQDISAYRWLSSHADTETLLRILKSEYLPEWLPYFSRAFSSLHRCGKGQYAFLGRIDNGDMLVVIADFFTRVHGITWIAVCGICRDTVIVVFRGDGKRTDLGAFAADRLGDLGTAGGHKALARAEFPLSAVHGDDAGRCVFQRLSAR